MGAARTTNEKDTEKILAAPTLISFFLMFFFGTRRCFAYNAKEIRVGHVPSGVVNKPVEFQSESIQFEWKYNIIRKTNSVKANAIDLRTRRSSFGFSIDLETTIENLLNVISKKHHGFQSEPKTWLMINDD